MINIIDKQQCCGCSACASICPKQCLSMIEDSEGFLYPQIDKEICIDCGLCEKVCHQLHSNEMREPLKVIAAINKSEEIRLKSSSGGIFYILAKKIINEGGVVFGARFDENWQVVIDYAEDLDGIEAFMGSKYVQARIENAYKDTKRFLTEGRKVLFSGTPCQVAGLYMYLRKSYDNLLTVDFICHGTPSPKVWGMYLDDVVKESQQIGCIEFRNKKNGWKNFGFQLTYRKEDNIISLFLPFNKDPYMNVFLKNIILRPSCYICKARSGKSKSDITLADFWGISKVNPSFDDDKGTSLVFLNSGNGMKEIDFTNCSYVETTYAKIKPLNPACYHSPKVNPKRKYFFSHLGSEDFHKLMERCAKPTRKERIAIFKKNVKTIIKKIIGKKYVGI